MRRRIRPTLMRELEQRLLALGLQAKDELGAGPFLARLARPPNFLWHRFAHQSVDRRPVEETELDGGRAWHLHRILSPPHGQTVGGRDEFTYTIGWSVYSNRVSDVRQARPFIQPID